MGRRLQYCVKTQPITILLFRIRALITATTKMGFAGLAGREGSRGKNQDINSALKGKNSYRLTYNTGFVIWSQLALKTQRTRVAAKILGLQERCEMFFPVVTKA